MLLPVFWLMTSSGLNPALIICIKSWPISLPLLVAWLKANASEFIFCLSPRAMSPMFFSFPKANSASRPKDIIVFCASISPLLSYTVAFPYSRICPTRFSIACVSPLSSVFRFACCCSKSREEPTMVPNACDTLPIALVMTSKLNAEVLKLSKKLFVFLALTNTFPNAASICAMPV